MSDGETILAGLLVVVIFVVGWTALEIQRLHASLDPIVNSPVLRAVT